MLSLYLCRFLCSLLFQFHPLLPDRLELPSSSYCHLLHLPIQLFPSDFGLFRRLLLLEFHLELLGRHVRFVLSGHLSSLLGGCSLGSLPLTLELRLFFLMQAFLILELPAVLLLRNSCLLFMFNPLTLHFQLVGLNLGCLFGLDLSGELILEHSVLFLKIFLLLLEPCDFLLCLTHLLRPLPIILLLRGFILFGMLLLQFLHLLFVGLEISDLVGGSLSSLQSGLIFNLFSLLSVAGDLLLRQTNLLLDLLLVLLLRNPGFFVSVCPYLLHLALMGLHKHCMVSCSLSG